jgi:hypothetical protein
MKTVESTTAALPRHFEGGSPEQMHPAQIDYASFDNNSALKTASDCLQFGWTRFLSIDELRANPNPQDQPATHCKKVREAVQQFEKQSATQWDRAKAEIIAETKRVEANLERSAGLKPDPRFEGAICNSFAAMNKYERTNAISKLVEGADGATLATLIEAPSILTGIEPAMRNSIRNQIFNKADPKMFALRNGLSAALGKLEDASYASITLRGKLSEGTDRYDHKIRSAEAIAAKAMTTGF